jgi:hypothetical protein
MHIVLAVLAILGGGAFWWYRMKHMAGAASEINDVAGRVWGKYKRYMFRKKAEASPIEAVKDPVAAAVVMMIAMVKEESQLTPLAEQEIEKEAVAVMKVEDTTELMTFAKCVANHAQDANSVSMRYSKLWANVMNRDERIELVEMVERSAAAVAPLTRNQAVQLSKIARTIGTDELRA